jgi:predicted NBD/HSP70 family sugar kinase
VSPRIAAAADEKPRRGDRRDSARTESPLRLRDTTIPHGSSKATYSSVAASTVQPESRDSLTALQRRWEANDPDARRLVTLAAEALAAALSNLCWALSPDCICLGGGVLTHLPGLFRTFEDATTAAGAAYRSLRVPVVWARLGDDAGMIGAAAIAMRSA